MRKGAAQALLLMSNSDHSIASVTPHVVAVVRSADPVARRAASKVLQRLDSHAPDREAGLLTDPNACVRAAAARGLGNIGETAAPHADALAKLLGDQEEPVRIAAVDAIERLGPIAATAAPCAAALLQDVRVSVRRCAAQALVAIGDAAEPYAAARNAAMMRDPDARHRRDAATDLGRQRKEAAIPYIQDLLALLADEDWKVRNAAAASLGSVSGAASADTVQQVLTKLDGLGADDVLTVRTTAAEAKMVLLSLEPQ